MLHRIALTEARLFYADPWYWKFQYLAQLHDFFLHLNDFWCSMICEEDYMLNAYSVSDITGRLSTIIQEFQEVYIQGKISSLTQNSRGVFWHLHDVDSATKQINCVHFDAPNLINCKIQLPNGNLVGEGDNIRVGGYIRLWPARSRYQIRVTQVLQHDDGTAQCQCDGCSQCSQQGCSQPRRIPQYGSCSSCLPLPPDELYELCSQCYGVSPDREPKVEEAVYGYLSEINIHGFLPQQQHKIQFGSRNGISDVVLVKGDDGTLAVVAECKGAGYVGHGIEQLKSYLSATDTRFGIFANRYDRSQWKFYENRRHNVFETLTRSQFENGVRAEIVLRPRFELEIRVLESQKASMETEIADLHQEKQTLETRITELKIQSEEKKKKGLINWLKNLFSKENS